MVHGQATEVIQSAIFFDWHSNLLDRRAKARIQMRIDRLALGNPGDVKGIGRGLSEMRIDYGPGYRVYFVQRRTIVVLLCGGTKKNRQADIARAIEIAEELEK
jgi:putative addiction module killer protein